MLAAILKWTKKNKSWLFVLSVIVVFCTTYVLILPAITLDEEEAARQGGIDIASEEQVADTASPKSADSTDDIKSHNQDAASTDKSPVQVEGSELSFEGDGFSVTAACDAKAGLPPATELSVTPIDENNQDYDAYCDEALAAIQAEDGGESVKELKFAYFYDISLMADGTPVEPGAPVDVAISYDEALTVNDAQNLWIVHFGVGKPEVLDPKNVSLDLQKNKMHEAAFTAENFSVYAVVYTVELGQEANDEVYDFSASGENYKITVTYGPDAEIPEGSELTVEEVSEDDERFQDYYEKALSAADGEASQDLYARFFDITIKNGAEIIEPKAPVSVEIKMADAPDEKDIDTTVVHFTEEEPVVIEPTVDDKDSICFETDSFSVYGVIVELAPTGANDLAGRTVKISNRGWYLGSQTINGNPTGISKTQDSSAAAEWTFESAGANGVYNIYTIVNGERQYIHITHYNGNDANWGDAFLSGEPQALTVSKNGNNYVIAGRDNGRDYHLNHWGSGSDNRFAAYSYYDSGDAQMTFTFTQPALENGEEYMVIVKQDEDYYIVLNDGTLAPVEYDETTGKVKADNPMLWYYSGDHLYHHSEQVGFDNYDLPSDYYYRYIDPTSVTGLNEDNSSNVRMHYAWHGGGIIDQRNLMPTTVLTYSNHRLRSTNTGSQYNGSYIGIDEDAMKIKGQVTDSGSAAEIYLAKVTEVPPSANLYHTVNHIDISIEGSASLDVPLAYGDYYYYDINGNRQTLTVSADNDVTLNLVKENVGITIDDMKRCEITAYSQQHGVLNDAFYVSGYSRNKQNDYSSQQVRIEGSFKVADLPPYTQYPNEDSISYSDLQARKDNRIYYTVTVKKDLTFNWEYEYEDEHGNKHKVQLYDITDQALSSTTMVNLSKSFDYWDPDNECPPVRFTQSDWSRGHIVWDTSDHTGSGMDFKLETHSQGDPNVLAVEITKYLKTDTGEILHPKSPVTNQFIVNQKSNSTQADYDSVIDVGVGDNQATVNTQGYSGIHAKSVTVGQSGEGVVYDYDVRNGMTYIAEDQDSIHREIVDTEGKRWKYVKTYVDTEYAWRQDGDEDKVHHADGLVSIPEVLGGPYGTYINAQGEQEALRNGFLPFFVTNVYERADDTVTLPVTKTWDDFARSDYKWEATFRLQYMERKISGDGPDTSVTTWTDYEPVNEVTLVKNAGSNQWSVDGSFGDLPKHREENDNVYERQYSADEVSFNVWKVVGGSEQLLYGYDGTNYTFGEGAEESIYTPFYDHDANEDWDGDWHLQISNSVGQKIEPRNINIGLQKTWQGGTPENASATFVLRRYKQTEYADYQGLEHNANILVLLTDSNGQVLSTIQTKSGKNVYIDATFAPNKTGTLTFTYQGQNYTVSNQTTTGAKVTVRSDPIRVTGNNGDTISVRMTAGDLANLAEGTSSNLRITDRQLENDLGEDTNFSRSITLPNDGDWQYTFENLPVEEGVWNSAGDHATITIYSYYLEETAVAPSNFTPEFRDSAGNVVSSENRIYNNLNVIARNLETMNVEATKTWHDINNGTVHPTIYFKLFYMTENGAVAVDAPLKPLENGTTNVTWENLPKFTSQVDEDDNPIEYVYHVREYIESASGEYEEGGKHYTAAAPNGYVKHENGLHVDNDESQTYIPPTTTYTGTKNWVDSGNKSARPSLEEFHVTLYADGVALDPQPALSWEDTDKDTWKYTFSDLPVFAADGHVIKYTVQETLGDGSAYTLTDTQQTETSYQLQQNQPDTHSRTLQRGLFTDQSMRETITLAKGTDIAYVIIPDVYIRGTGVRTIAWTQRGLSNAEKNEFTTRFGLTGSVQWVSTIPYSPTTVYATLAALLANNPVDISIAIRGSDITVSVNNHALVTAIEVLYGSLRNDYVPGTTDLTNTLDLFGFDILKVEEDSLTHLPEADFTIQQVNQQSSTSDVSYADGSSPETKTTDENGKTSFSDLVGGCYEVKETKTPAGYVLTGEDAFYIKLDAKGVKFLNKVIEDNKLRLVETEDTEVGNAKLSIENNVVTFTVENEPGTELPSAGGPGTTWLYLLGTLLLLGCGTILVARRRMRLF